MDILFQSNSKYSVAVSDKGTGSGAKGEDACTLFRVNRKPLQKGKITLSRRTTSVSIIDFDHTTSRQVRILRPGRAGNQAPM